MLLLIVVSFITDESDSRVAMKWGDTPFPKNQVTCIGYLNGSLLVDVELTGSWIVDRGQIWRECVVLNVLWDN